MDTYKDAIFWTKNYTSNNEVIGPQGARWSSEYRYAVPRELWKQLAWKREHIPTLVLVA